MTNYETVCMNRICTTIEQSQKLIELGIDTNTADMVWIEDFDHNYDLEPRVNIVESYNPNNLKMIPAWSLSALFILLPKEARLLKSAINDTYECDYPYEVSEWYDNPLDAVFEAICKLLKK